MTRSDYIEAGFRLSLQVDERLISRAEGAVEAAYLKPIGGSDYTADCAEWKACVMACAYLWLLQHNVVATAAGAKAVNVTSAESVSDYEVLRQAATDAAAAIATFRAKVASDHATDSTRPDGSGSVTDICRIFFETNYFGFN